MPTRRHSTSLPEAGVADSSPDLTGLVAFTPDSRPSKDFSLQVDGASVSVVPAATSRLGSDPRSDGGDSSGGSRAAAAATAVLLHGAGSGTDVPVLRELRALLVAGGVTVASVEMPYRVAGRRAPDRPARLDAVLRATVAELGRPRPLVLAGRSMGSRVACRCATDVGAAGVLALGFPLTPPGARPSRLPELLATGVPVLVVQGDRDSFGLPAADPSRDLAVHVVPGADHSLRRRKSDPGTTEQAEAEAAEVGARWLLRRLAASRESGAAAHGFG
jgi:uncharacterized protein